MKFSQSIFVAFASAGLLSCGDGEPKITTLKLGGATYILPSDQISLVVDDRSKPCAPYEKVCDALSNFPVTFVRIHDHNKSERPQKNYLNRI